MRAILRFCFLICLLPLLSSAQTPADTAWPTYGGDPGGMRFTSSTQVAPANVAQLAPAWVFHTGSVAKQRPGTSSSSFEATPILFRGLLYLSSPYDEVFALNPTAGAAIWSYDPAIAPHFIAGIFTSRGVAAWPLESAPDTAPVAAPPTPPSAAAPCSARIFVATMDTRLIALDAATGKPCQDFADHGSLDLTNVTGYTPDARYYQTSPPTVIGDLVVVGSCIGDNQAVDQASGVVRAFDVHTGRLVWSWEPLPWAQHQRLRTGAGNAWSVIAADPEHHLLFIPTGSASPDFYGGMRPGDNRDADSVVAIDAPTGRRVWGFQVVHHNLWDYDVAAEPLLFTFRGTTPAIAIPTKQGLVFVLNRLTGEPLFPVTERPVPSSTVPGESPSRTQPFPANDSLSPLTIDRNAALGLTGLDNKECRELFAGLRYDGIYTPPSIHGSLQFPGNIGGVNWGSAAFDPATGILYANTNRYAFSVTLEPRNTVWQWYWSMEMNQPRRAGAARALFAVFLVLLIAAAIRRSFFPGWPTIAVCVLFLAADALWIRKTVHPVKARTLLQGEHFRGESGDQIGTPYILRREPVTAPTSGNPCTPTPWGTVSALNLNTGKSVWQVPLGASAGQPTGTLNVGGDLVTASGLLFTAASEQPLLRAFDSATGKELWQGALPVPAQATPMSYTLAGREYIVIAAGGHGMFGTPISDAVVAFALPAH